MRCTLRVPGDGALSHPSPERSPGFSGTRCRFSDATRRMCRTSHRPRKTRTLGLYISRALADPEHPVQLPRPSMRMAPTGGLWMYSRVDMRTYPSRIRRVERFPRALSGLASPAGTASRLMTEWPHPA